jgi:hypothetical protein
VLLPADDRTGHRPPCRSCAPAAARPAMRRLSSCPGVRGGRRRKSCASHAAEPDMDCITALSRRCLRLERRVAGGDPLADPRRAGGILDVDELDLPCRLRRERTRAHASRRRRIKVRSTRRASAATPAKYASGTRRSSARTNLDRPCMGMVVGVGSDPERVDHVDAGDISGAILNRGQRRLHRCDYVSSLPVFAGHRDAVPSSMPRYCVPQAQSASITGRRVLPNSVTAYSTRGGTSG